jgi:2-iminobutanoate/2-iminopropanoate deaminase
MISFAFPVRSSNPIKREYVDGNTVQKRSSEERSQSSCHRNRRHHGRRHSQPVADNTPSAPPLFSSAVSYGNLLFLAGVGAHFEGTIEEHTKHVLDELEKNLTCAGSSMDKVLKVNVYLNDIKDWARMNTVYAGRWGKVPPVRTTIAPAGGIPGNSLVEIDLIAYI